MQRLQHDGSVGRTLGGVLLAWLAAAALWRAWVWITAPQILPWEATAIIEGMVAEIGTPRAWWAVLADACRWNDGILSRGDLSLVYGPWTLGLLRMTTWPTPVLLRIAPVVAWLAGGWALYRLTWDRDAVVRCLMPVVLWWSLPTAFYAAYGSSLSATIALSTVGLVCAVRLLRARPRWWLGPLTGVVLSLDTFGYACGRLVVIGIVCSLPLWWCVARTRPTRRQAVGVLSCCAVLAACVWWQWDRLPLLLHARGEQVFSLRFGPVDGAWAGRTPDGLLQTLAYFYSVVADRWPELLATVSWTQRIWPWTHADPPPMHPYPLAALPLLALALLSACWRADARSTLWVCLWVTGAVVGGALLSTRVDSHRLAVLMAVVIVLCATGVDALPRWWLRWAAVVAVACGLWWERAPDEWTTDRAAAADIERAILLTYGPVELITHGVSNQYVAEGVLRGARRTSGPALVLWNHLAPFLAERRPEAVREVCARARGVRILLTNRAFVEPLIEPLAAVGCEVYWVAPSVARLIPMT